jgi:hypothetical protein
MCPSRGASRHKAERGSPERVSRVGPRRDDCPLPREWEWPCRRARPGLTLCGSRPDPLRRAPAESVYRRSAASSGASACAWAASSLSTAAEAAASNARPMAAQTRAAASSGSASQTHSRTVAMTFTLATSSELDLRPMSTPLVWLMTMPRCWPTQECSASPARGRKRGPRWKGSTSHGSLLPTAKLAKRDQLNRLRSSFLWCVRNPLWVIVSRRFPD